MKKLFMVLGLVLVIAVPTEIMAESALMKAWKQWVIMRNVVLATEEKEVKSPVIIERDTLGDEANYKPKWLSNTRRYSSRNYYSINKVDAPIRSTKLRTQVSAVRPLDMVHKITSDPIKIFEVGVRLQDMVRSSDFREAILLDKARFRLFQNSGIADDLDKIQLLINDEEFDLDDDGSGEVQFHNARVAVGESMSFDVSVKLKDPSVTPHVAGNLLLRMESLSARGEQSGVAMKSFMYGDLVSKKLIFIPAPEIDSGKNSEVVLQSHKTLYGRMLDEGEEAVVLIGQFSSNYDDLYVRGATLRNVLTGGNIDSLIEEVIAVNLESGKVLDRSRFIGGAVRFDFSPDVFVGRGDDVRIGFQVVVDDRLSAVNFDSRFKLALVPDDLVVQSATTGRELGSSAKNFTIESEEFSVSSSQMTVYPSAEQNSFAVGISRPVTIYRFNVAGKDLDLGRVSFDVYPSGLTFAGGSLSADDVALVRVNDNREYDEAVNVSVSGNNVVLDFPDSYKVWDDVVEFGLQLDLEDLPGNSDSDLVSVRMLGDSSYGSGNLAQVCALGASFIWSDQSARIHSTVTSDWFTGYKVSGLPTNTTVVRRFGN